MNAMSLQASFSNSDLGDVSYNISIPACVLGERFSEMVQNCSLDMNGSLSLFNIDGLKCEAEKFFGKTCTGCYLVAQGAFNTVYILTFSSRGDVVARLLASRINSDARRSQELVIERKKSEGVIYRFLKDKTTIPIPHIYYFTPYFNNPVKVPYMFMDRVHGQILADVWLSLSSEQKIKVFSSVIEYNAQLLQLEFNAVGVLQDHGDGFVIGPLGISCSDARLLPGFRGPFITTTSYLQTGAKAHLHFIMHNKEDWEGRRLLCTSINGGADDISVEYATTWLQLFCKGIRGLPAEPITSVLCHDDLSLANVMVSYDDPTKVVAVIDWEGSRVMPIWDDWPFSAFINDALSRQDDENLANQFRNVRNSIYTKANSQFGSSRLKLDSLMFFTDIFTMADHSRELINNSLLCWYEEICNDGHLEEICSFSALKNFIDSGSHM